MKTQSDKHLNMKEKPFKWYEIILPVLLGWFVTD